MTEALNDRDHALYRFFGAGGTLLYVGITMNLPTRIGDHRDGKPWWLAVANVTVEHFPDRPSVLEAERRAIQNEKPLYNVQHNRPDPKPSRERLAPSSPLTAICMTCRKKILGSKGAIHIVDREVRLVEQSIRARKERRMRALIAAESIEDPEMRRRAIWDTRTMSGARLLEGVGEEVDWMVHCDDCNPHPIPEESGGGWCGGCYWFSTDRCRTWAQLVEWTCHLSEKSWLGATNWMDWIRSIAHATTTVGLVARPVDTYGAAGC